jgi:hypothetical protein
MLEIGIADSARRGVLGTGICSGVKLGVIWIVLSKGSGEAVTVSFCSQNDSP